MVDLVKHLKKIYENPEQINKKINKIIKKTNEKVSWSEKDTILITYSDTIEGNLKGVEKLLDATRINSAHILPFHPYSSDKGFSVKDFEKVREDAISFEYLKSISSKYKLCFDLVLNHVSKEHKWFKQFLENEKPGKDYFIEVKDFDTSKVFRPRDTPLATSFETVVGEKKVWTTFSSDQIDLNYKNPEVLLEIIKVLQTYLESGASIVRLDAVAYIFKKSSSSCVHEREVYEIVKIFRKLMNYIKPGSLLLTETNFPHKENISYLSKDKANMIYQFPLPPLILYSIENETALELKRWMKSSYEKEGYYLNFTSSHDGIGLTPLYRQGLNLNLERFVISFGKAPYEINNTYYSALKTGNLDHEKFMLSQILMISLKGIPGIYISSLFGREDNIKKYKKTGIKRDLNREKFNEKQIKSFKENKIYKEYKKIIKLRTKLKGFDPKVNQKILKTKEEILAFERADIKIICNFTSKPQETDFKGFDIITGKEYKNKINLKPYQIMWIK